MDFGGGIEKQLMPLDGDQARHDAHKRRLWRDSPFAAHGSWIGHVGGELGEIQPQWYDRDARRASDSESGELAALLLGHGDDLVRDACQHALQDEKEPDQPGAEIAAPEDMAVKRVDDDGHAAQPGGYAPEQARLGRVRVHDVGPFPGDKPYELGECHEVGKGPNLAPKLSYSNDRDTQTRCHLEHVAFAGCLRPADEECGVRRPQAVSEQNGVHRGPPDVKPGDHADDFRHAGPSRWSDAAGG